MLFDGVEVAEIAVDRDAGIVDEEVEALDLIDCPLDLGSVGHVQCQRYHALVDALQWSAGASIHPLGPSPERLFDERPTARPRREPIRL